MKSPLRLIRPLPALLLASLTGIHGLHAQRTINYADFENNCTNYDTSAPNDPTTLHSLDAGSATQSGNLSGTGSIIKTGAGSITLSGDNTYSGGTILESGTLRLTDVSSFGDTNGTITINGGALGTSAADVVAMIDNDFVVNSDFSIDAMDEAGGTLGALEIFGNVDFGAGTSRTITLTSTGLACFGGVLSGHDLTFITSASSSLAMFCSDTANTFTGTLRVGERVTLELIKAGGDSPTAVSGNLTVDAGGEVIVANAAQFASTSNVIVNGTISFTQTSGSNTFHTLGGTGTVTALSDFADVNTLEVHGGTFDGSLTESGGTLVLKKTGADTLNLTGASVYTGATIVEGGTLDVSGSIAESAIQVNAGGTLRGSGSVGEVTVSAGGTITAGSDGAPGLLSTGKMTWESGGTYEWKLNDASGLPGVTSDWLNINGDLVLNATTMDPFTIKVTSLTPGGAPGPADGFDPASDYSWVLATATGAVLGFVPEHFAIDTSGFANQPGSTRFTVSVEDHNLVLKYSAVPEPGAVGFCFALGLLAFVARRAARRWEFTPAR